MGMLADKEDITSCGSILDNFEKGWKAAVDSCGGPSAVYGQQIQDAPVSLNESHSVDSLVTFPTLPELPKQGAIIKEQKNGRYTTYSIDYNGTRIAESLNAKQSADKIAKYLAEGKSVLSREISSVVSNDISYGYKLKEMFEAYDGALEAQKANDAEKYEELANKFNTLKEAVLELQKNI